MTLKENLKPTQINLKSIIITALIFSLIIEILFIAFVWLTEKNEVYAPTFSEILIYSPIYFLLIFFTIGIYTALLIHRNWKFYLSYLSTITLIIFLWTVISLSGEEWIFIIFLPAYILILAIYTLMIILAMRPIFNFFNK
jgi:uncharacterized membrane protein